MRATQVALRAGVGVFLLPWVLVSILIFYWELRRPPSFQTDPILQLESWIAVAGDAPQTIHRIIDIYPPTQIATVRAQLSISLAGIVSQQLLPRSDGKGRVPAVEILVATPGVRNLIRRGNIEQIRAQITLESNAGMLDLDKSLARLVREGLVDALEARARARVPENFEY